MSLPQVGWVIAALHAEPRKVRTPQNTVPGNTRGGVTCRIGPQKHTADGLGLFPTTGKGETEV
jgi:hypothetical protein